jgi:hypothetical protein
MSDPGATVRPHDHQVDLLFLRIPQDFTDGLPGDGPHMDIQPAPIGFVEEVIQSIEDGLRDELFPSWQARRRTDVPGPHNTARLGIIGHVQDVQRGTECPSQLSPVIQGGV